MFTHSDLSDENIYKVIDLLNVCVYWKDKKGTYLGGNRYWLNLLGFKHRSDIIGKNDFAIFSKEDAERIMEIDKAVMQDIPYHNEESAILINGQIKIVVTDKTPLLNSERKIVGLLGISMDITDIKNKREMEKQQAILNEGQKFWQIIDLVDASIYWKDREGRYLGCNQYVLNMIGFNSRNEILGKTDFDLTSQEDAQKIRSIDNLVMTTDTPYEGEEFFTLPNKNNKHMIMLTVKNRLLNEQGEVIGIVGTSLDIAAQKEAEKLMHENEKRQLMLNQEQKLVQIIDLVDASIYWKDTEGRYLGCNKYVLDMAGLESRDEIIGKTDFDLLWKEDAEKLREIDKLVMTTAARYEGEELIAMANKQCEQSVVFTVKNRLLDDKDNIVGIVGTSLDITAKKEAETLKIENEKHKAIEGQQREFRKIIEQIVHDIRSPIGALRMNLNESKHYLPEPYRVTFNKSVSRIDDIAYRLLNVMKPTQAEIENPLDKIKEPTLISNEILEVMAEKRYEYRERSIDFGEHFSESAYFAFLNTNASDFKRMLSNLINNAVDAIQDKIGRVDVRVDVADDQIQIMVEDDGGGMPDEVKEKILNNIAVTSGKANGHGIGFGQIRDTIKESEGQLAIESQEGEGTKIILTFPEVGAPDWVATHIQLFRSDTLVILDDDASIHDAWEARFQKVAPELPRHHFKEGKDAVAFINSFDEAAKKKLLLLTDFELLEQELHGLEVVEKTSVKRSVLVTSHNDNPKVRKLAKAQNTKILPKPLAAHVPIEVKEAQAEPAETKQETLHSADIVYVDDDEDILEVVSRAIRRRGKEVDAYSSVYKFLENKAKYSKDTKIILDNQFQREYARGIEIAQELHEEGYTSLYLFSGEDFRFNQDTVIPDYLTVILKSDIDMLLEILTE